MRRRTLNSSASRRRLYVTFSDCDEQATNTTDKTSINTIVKIFFIFFSSQAPSPLSLQYRQEYGYLQLKDVYPVSHNKVALPQFASTIHPT
jgi:hypothetical protein